MTTATLIIHQPDGEDITSTITVNTPEEVVHVKIGPERVDIYSPVEPTVVIDGPHDATCTAEHEGECVRPPEWTPPTDPGSFPFVRRPGSA